MRQHCHLVAYRPATSCVHYTTSCNTQSSAAEDGRVIARNMLSRLELLINSYCCIYLVVYIICINDARSNRYHTYRRFGTTYRPHLPGVKNGFSEPLKMSNNPEGRSSHLLRSAILKSGPVGVQYDVQFISLTSWPNIDSFNSLKPRENKNK